MGTVLSGRNIIVIDLETARSANDCRHCGKAFSVHCDAGACLPGEEGQPGDGVPHYAALGWNDKGALGLSIGCYYDYADGWAYWFDAATLETMVQMFVRRRPLLVSFNGISFDFPLMCEVLRHHAPLVQSFTDLYTTSYDILSIIWTADPHRKFERGLNSLGAISLANGYGAKELDGAAAPRLWAQGCYATVLNYCAGDVWKTKALFEQIVATGSLLRGDGLSIGLPLPEIL